MRTTKYFTLKMRLFNIQHQSKFHEFCALSIGQHFHGFDNMLLLHQLHLRNGHFRAKKNFSMSSNIECVKNDTKYN